MTQHTVVVLSGGMDSTTLMAVYADNGDQLSAITINYGQRHLREVDAARDVARYYGATHCVVDLPDLARVLSGSSLTDTRVAVPLGHYAAPTMAATVVPNRNAILANVAVGYAVAQKADRVALGVHAGDHPIYPDCRPEFIDALRDCVKVATAGYHTPDIEAPFVGISKTAVCSLGVALHAPLGISWSCYQGGDLHCGQCGTCTERIEAFAEAGYADPTQYAARADG